MKEIIVVTIGKYDKTSGDYEIIAVSGEGYDNLKNAISFIESRADSPQKIEDRFIWTSKDCDYSLKFISIR